MGCKGKTYRIQGNHTFQARSGLNLQELMVIRGFESLSSPKLTFKIYIMEEVNVPNTGCTDPDEFVDDPCIEAMEDYNIK